MNYLLRIFDYRLYVKEWLLLFLMYFIMEGVFFWLVLPNSGVEANYEKLLSIFIFGFTLWHFNRLTLSEKIFAGAFTALIIKCMVESIFRYNSLFQQFTIFTVLFPVIYVVFIKYILRRLDVDLLGFVAKFYLCAYILFMVLYGRGFGFSLEMVEMDDYGPFSGDSRIIHARSIFMIIIPLLWYLHQFIKEQKLKYFLPLLFCLMVILLHQHRSVWSSAIVALFFYVIFLVKEDRTKMKKLAAMGAWTIGLLLLAYFFISQLYPQAIDFFSERFSEILDPAKEGSTGNFRLEQSGLYGDYILQKPVFGWSFQGFYLPNPLVDWWDVNTGHHFHEGFIEILFYHGIAGLILKYSFLAMILIKAFTRRLSFESAILSAFCISGLIFSLNYVLPLIFWGHVGLCLFYLDLDKQ